MAATNQYSRTRCTSEPTISRLISVSPPVDTYSTYKQYGTICIENPYLLMNKYLAYHSPELDLCE